MVVYRSGRTVNPTMDDAIWGICLMTPPELKGQTSFVWTMGDRLLWTAKQFDEISFTLLFIDLKTNFPDVVLPAGLSWDESPDLSLLDATREIERQMLNNEIYNQLRPNPFYSNLTLIRKVVSLYVAATTTTTPSP